ncbi:MAG: pyrimidine-nucleoside phosphorylase [Actinobacteria bacterium]|nr:pyrimidine-nucleoside phosphorylase [Actinomycetota bacterium]
MNTIEIIQRKRDGGALSADEIGWVITEYTADRLPDYQMSALLMAIFKAGLDGEELAAWVDAMLHSGDTLDFSHVAAPKVDKHSTGGVGDKVSIALGPMAAACGVAVPMMSGRALGHTGGTLDKLETIPGFRTALDPPEFREILARTNLVLAGQSETLVPADRRLYALRDATGTVESIPLISSSIMSKKLAEGLDALVLDVKVGRGAFIKDPGQARVLAETMVGIGASHGVPVRAVLTDMSQPLGREVGNACEVAEAVEVLRGKGPADLVEVTYRLCEEMLLAGGVSTDRAVARARLERAVASGAALAKLAEVVEAQGGDPAVIHDPSLLARAPEEHTVTAPLSGYLARADALDIGVAGVRLGAGRERKEDPIDPGVGITVLAKVGDPVEADQPLARLAWADPGRLAQALPLVERAFAISKEPVAPPPLIHGEVP